MHLPTFLTNHIDKLPIPFFRGERKRFLHQAIDDLHLSGQCSVEFRVAVPWVTASTLMPRFARWGPSEYNVFVVEVKRIVKWGEAGYPIYQGCSTIFNRDKFKNRRWRYSPKWVSYRRQGVWTANDSGPEDKLRVMWPFLPWTFKLPHASASIASSASILRLRKTVSRLRFRLNSLWGIHALLVTSFVPLPFERCNGTTQSRRSMKKWRWKKYVGKVRFYP